MATLRIVNPVAETKAEAGTGGRFNPAPRLRDYNGKVIGMYWNAKAGGDIALARTKENLARVYPEATFLDIFAAHGAHARMASKGQVEELKGKVQAIVGTTGD
ncbi:MAG: hypothetical protein EXR49_01185 [Dehalococcoidia bacterium]|nr:hypothetical protein [Dehalococcoidia bacterium]